MAIKALFVDFGNVCATFDFALGIQNLARYARVTEADVRSVLTAPEGHGYSKLFAAFECGQLVPAEFFGQLMDELGASGHATYSEFARIWTNIFFSENDALSELLDAVSTQKYLLSNTNQIVHSRYITDSKIVKRHFPWPNRILSYKVGAIKPDRRIYDEAFSRAEKPAGECLFIDDMPLNIEAWETLGGHGIVYNARCHSIDYLRRNLELFGLL